MVCFSQFIGAIGNNLVGFLDFFGQLVDFYLSPEDAAPALLTSLRTAGHRLVPAFFSGDLAGVSDLLAPDAAIDLPDLRGRSVSAMDYAVDDDQAPTRAVLSVRNRELEDSYDYLTVELAYENGQWLVTSAGLEK